MMELNEAKEILTLAALADAGVKVDFLTKPEGVEVFVYVEPRSVQNSELCVKLHTVQYRNGLPAQSCIRRHKTPSAALKWLSRNSMARLGEVGIVAPHFPNLLKRLFAASEHDIFEAAFARVKWEDD
ncbi:UNVERIFIED_ORG: hypothetical protein J2W85_002378 [Ensifer adhaerens]|nr:hypothetical protein [Ensifer adhaerens]